MGRVQSRRLGYAVWAMSLILSCGAANAVTRADCEQEYKPQTGQPGKDVIWVPTNDALVERMLRMAKTTSSDLVYDLGAGDGKIAIAAAKKFGARSVGVEYNPDMAKYAQCLVNAEGVSDRTKVIQGDIFETDFSSATVVTLYLLPELNLRLRPTLLKMKPGTRVVSHSFLMDDWEPDERSTEDGYAYLWIVPAQVQGTWTFVPQQGGERFVAQLEQTFQVLRGTVGAGANAKDISDAKLDGAEIQFNFVSDRGTARLKGRLNGSRIEATVTDGNNRQTRYIGTRS